MTAIAFDISKILNRLLTLHEISEAELGRKIDVPRATINRLASGRTPDPRTSTVEAIANYFNVSVDQLLGKQPLFANANKNIIATVGTSLPIIDWKETENWKGVISQLKPENHFDWIMVDPSTGKGLFALRVRGESMWPQFQENTILVIDPDKKEKNKDFVIAYIRKNEEVVFRQLIIEGKYTFLKAINSIFPVIKIEKSDRVIGVVIQTRNSYDEN